MKKLLSLTPNPVKLASLLLTSGLIATPVWSIEFGGPGWAPVEKPASQTPTYQTQPPNQPRSQVTPNHQVAISEVAPGPVTAAAVGAQASADSGLAELLQMVETLRVEVQELRGTVEEQAHMIQRMRDEQRRRYLDLDKRISQGLSSADSGTSNPSSSQPSSADSAASSILASDEKQAYKAAFSLVRKKDYPAAIEAFKQFITAFPEGSLIGNAYYWLGEVHLVLDQALEAQQAFAAVVNQYPDNQKVSGAKYKLGLIYKADGRSAEAKKLFQQVMTDHPNSTAASMAQTELRKMP